MKLHVSRDDWHVGRETIWDGRVLCPYASNKVSNVTAILFRLLNDHFLHISSS